ncbi:CoA transferase [Cognatiyoonia sp. IB215446]|uniref:CaiB/BaiF CoA transferase family protein n=1 Tax=Cognatiyoonia sp. IB215446 TaxID=3097355 RepID=UPI002A12FFA1|nr:CoA transferase [Cognatiyoonia sp. IB215446]MDX8348070.1 CoA transferase [Cognatiyoonia sp. IB215446]
MSKPLKDIRVLDLTNVLAGPFCCHHLAHLGAEVIKVEARGRGDLARQLGADPALNAAGMGVSFLAQNAGKKSVTLDLKKPDGKALFRRLVGSADVLVENFRPGVMDRLGLGYGALKEVRPELIYCAISGFGQDGPWKDRPAYDQIIQGASGVMSITGDAGSAPLRVGYPVADTFGGMNAAFAVAAALNERPRGCFIDVSMLESVLVSMGWVVSNHLIAGVTPQANGNENVTSAPSGTFCTAEGMINIAANKDEQWVVLTGHLGLEALRDHPDYATREARKVNRVALRQALEVVLMTKPAAHWVEALNAIGVPTGAVLSVPEALATPQVAERGFLQSYEDVAGVGRDIAVATTGVKIDGAAPIVADPPPELGADNDAVWGDLGLSAAEIARLREDEVI